MTNQRSGNAEWLERIINECQKEVNTWDSYKREVMQREAERKHFQQDNRSYGNF